MRLTGFNYQENGWILADTVEFGECNLLVGKNAVGKSRTLQAIARVLALLAQKSVFYEYEEIESSIVLKDNDLIYQYHFAFSRKSVVCESLMVNEKTIIDRNEETASISGELVNPPVNKLILQTRRDVDLYPEIERIVTWAERMCSFSFIELGDFEFSTPKSLSFRYENAFVKDLYSMMSSFDEVSKNEIVRLLNEVGYPVTELLVRKEFKAVFVTEKEVHHQLTCSVLSKGMYRTLYVLTSLVYYAGFENPGLLLIDDLCEGLDYDRSIKLGKIVFEYCKKHFVQLIASSNDSFLMDIVDIDNWNILTREGSSVKVVNKLSNPDLFERFKMTGLNNFDFFSSDFIARHTN